MPRWDLWREPKFIELNAERAGIEHLCQASVELHVAGRFAHGDGALLTMRGHNSVRTFDFQRLKDHS